jgi:hypothetical protein
MMTALATISVNAPVPISIARLLATAVLDDQIGAEVLVEALDRRILDRGLEQRVQHVEAGLVGREPGALDLHAAKRAHVDVTVVLAVPGAAPVLELHHLLGAMGHEVVDDVLLAEPVAAGHRIVEMILPTVVGQRDRRGAAFGRHGVAAHRINLGDERNPKRGIGLRRCDRRAQTCATRTNDRDVRVEDFHCAYPPGVADAQHHGPACDAQPFNSGRADGAAL